MIEAHFMNDLDNTPISEDPSLYTKCCHGVSVGIIGLYVYHSLRAKYSVIEKPTEQTSNDFDPKLRVYNQFKYFDAQNQRVKVSTVLVS